MYNYPYKMSIYQIFQNEININYKNIYAIKNYLNYDSDLITTIYDELLKKSKENILTYIENLIFISDYQYLMFNATNRYIINDIKQLKNDGCKFNKNDINDIYIEHLDLIKHDLNSVIYYNFY